MTNFPKRVRIGHIDYDVELDLTLPEGLDGKIEYSDSRIRIRTGMSVQYTWSVLMHEMIHGVITNFYPCLDGAPNKEGLVEAISIGVQQMLRDNPMIAACFLKR
jgi:hypothetical protein